MAALAPIPSASVTTTVMASPLTRDSDRNATRKSVRMFICPCRLADAEIDTRPADDRLPYLAQEENMAHRMRSTVLAAAIFKAGSMAAAQPPAGGGGQARGGGRGPATPPLIMTTTAWEDGGVIPERSTQASSNAVSPELKWSQVPPGTQSFVLLMHDPEPVLNKGSKMDITHWLVWNIPGASTGFSEGLAQGELPDGTRQVSLRSNAYMGPGAPPGPYHHYTFELYALDTKLDVPQGTPQEAAATRTAVVNAMDGVDGATEVRGRERRRSRGARADEAAAEHEQRRPRARAADRERDEPLALHVHRPGDDRRRMAQAGREVREHDAPRSEPAPPFVRARGAAGPRARRHRRAPLVQRRLRRAPDVKADRHADGAAGDRGGERAPRRSCAVRRDRAGHHEQRFGERRHAEKP